MRFDEFVGGAYQSVSPNADASRSVNLLVERNESAGAKARAILIGRPGTTGFVTLPTTGVRGLAAGEGRMFAATATRLYEVTQAAAVTELGIIATDAANTPVQIFLNGRQLFVVSAGNAYVHDGVQLVRCIDGGAATKEGTASILRYKVGVVNTSGTSVAWASGDLFDSVTHATGKLIYIAGIPYTIASYISTTSLTVASSAGTLSAVPAWTGSKLTWTSGDQFDSVSHAAGNLVQVEGSLYEISLYISVTEIVLKQDSGLDAGNWKSLVAVPEIVKAGTVNTNGTAVTYASGALFDSVIHQAGNQIVINGLWYTIASYNSAASLTLYGSGAGVQTGANYVTYKFLAAITGGYLNGYFLAQQPKTLPDGSDGRQVRISGLLDGSSWDSLDFVSKEGRPDSLRSILVDNLEVYMFGQKTVEVWRATDGESILARDPGAFAEFGSLCRWAPVSLAGAVYFISGDDRGQPVGMRMRGLVPERISTAAIEKEWQAYARAGTLEDAIGFPYVESGHSFWVLQFPTAGKTWVYDAGTELWHEWAWLDAGTLYRHRGRCHVSVWGKHLQGDWTTGIIYESGFHLFSDNPGSIRCMRQAPHLHSGEEDRVFYEQFQLDMDTGTSPSGEPSIVLDWSEDDGVTWSGQKIAGGGAPGEHTKRVIWRRLGAGRDRVFRVTVDSAARQAWTAAIVKLRGEK